MSAAEGVTPSSVVATPTGARPDCSCPVEAEGTQYEVRILDRACPRHGTRLTATGYIDAGERFAVEVASARPTPVRSEVLPVGARGDERRQQAVRKLLDKHAATDLPIEALAWIILGSLTLGTEDREAGAWLRAVRVVFDAQHAAPVAAPSGDTAQAVGA